MCIHQLWLVLTFCQEFEKHYFIQNYCEIIPAFQENPLHFMRKPIKREFIIFAQPSKKKLDDTNHQPSRTYTIIVCMVAGTNDNTSPAGTCPTSIMMVTMFATT
jgi:hypothetical protein